MSEQTQNNEKFMEQERKVEEEEEKEIIFFASSVKSCSNESSTYPSINVVGKPNGKYWGVNEYIYNPEESEESEESEDDLGMLLFNSNINKTDKTEFITVIFEFPVKVNKIVIISDGGNLNKYLKNGYMKGCDQWGNELGYSDVFSTVLNDRSSYNYNQRTARRYRGKKNLNNAEEEKIRYEFSLIEECITKEIKIDLSFHPLTMDYNFKIDAIGVKGEVCFVMLVEKSVENLTKGSYMVFKGDYDDVKIYVPYALKSPILYKMITADGVFEYPEKINIKAGKNLKLWLEGKHPKIECFHEELKATFLLAQSLELPYLMLHLINEIDDKMITRQRQIINEKRKTFEKDESKDGKKKLKEMVELYFDLRSDVKICDKSLLLLVCKSYIQDNFNDSLYYFSNIILNHEDREVSKDFLKLQKVKLKEVLTEEYLNIEKLKYNKTLEGRSMKSLTSEKLKTYKEKFSKPTANSYFYDTVVFDNSNFHKLYISQLFYEDSSKDLVLVSIDEKPMPVHWEILCLCPYFKRFIESTEDGKMFKENEDVMNKRKVSVSMYHEYLVLIIKFLYQGINSLVLSNLEISELILLERILRAPKEMENDENKGIYSLKDLFKACCDEKSRKMKSLGSTIDKKLYVELLESFGDSEFNRDSSFFEIKMVKEKHEILLKEMVKENEKLKKRLMDD